MYRDTKERGIKPGGRLAGILLSLILMLAMLPLAAFANDADDAGTDAFWADGIYILGHQVTSDNCGDVLGDGGSVQYDRETGTVTLTDATLDLAQFDASAFNETNKVYGISTWKETELVLNGDNKIVSTADSFADGMEYVYGVEADYPVNISGSGTLSIDINTGAPSIERYYGIDSQNRLSIDGSSVSVSMTGSGDSYGIFSGWKGFHITGGAEVSAVSRGGSSWAVYDSSYKHSEVEFGSSLEMSSDYGAFQFSRLPDFMTEGSILVSDDPEPEDPQEWDKTTRLSSYQYVKLLGSENGAERSSAVYLLGRKLEDGAVPDSVPHTGEIYYDEDAGMLTLTDAAIDLDKFSTDSPGNLTAGIYAMSDLRVILLGSSKIYAKQNYYSTDTEYVSGIEGWGDITIVGKSDASLTIDLAGNNSSNKNIQFCGIASDGGIYFNGTSTEVNMGSCGKCTGVYAWEPLVLDAGALVRVNADGSNSKAVSGINSIGNSEINGDSVLVMSSDGTAFNCWTPGATLKAADAKVGIKRDGSDAATWDKHSALYDYKYVMFMTASDESSGGEGRFGDDVRVLGRKIDESNCDDVFGDGKVKFDMESDTLTLTNAELDLKDFHHEYDDDPNPDSGCNIVTGIDADRSITIVLSGRNRIFSSVSSYDAKKQYVRGIENDGRGAITVTGAGSLEIDLDMNNETLSYEGIDTGKGLIVDGAAVKVNMSGDLGGTGIDCRMMSELVLKNGAEIRVSAAGESSTAVDYIVASDMRIEDGSMMEMVSDGTAFDCWMLSDQVKELGALVNAEPTAEGAEAWDKTTVFEKYKYVRFPEEYTHVHNISHVDRKDATCTADGYEEYWICSKCGLMFSDGSGADDKIIEKPVVIPASGEHSWDKGKVTKLATLFRKGEKMYTCTVCGATKTEKYSLKDVADNVIDKVKEWIRNIFGDDDPGDGSGDISKAMTVSLSAAEFIYNGEVQKPEITSVKLGDTELGEGAYSVKWSDSASKDAGLYNVTVSVEGDEGITGTKSAGYRIKKAANPVTVSGKTATMKYRKLKKKARTLDVSAVMDVSGAQGTLIYQKTSGSDKIKVDRSTGNVRLKKKLRKGTYSVTVRVTAAGNRNYNAATKTVNFKVKVK